MGRMAVYVQVAKPYLQDARPFQYTHAQAKQLGVRGWIRNTSRRTVEGQIEGELPGVEQM